MRVSDIVTRLAVTLPQLTDKLTNEIPVNSLTRSGTVITAACDEAHELEPGNAVSIVGAVVPIRIFNLTRVGTVGTLVTDTAHDLTEPITSSVTISGALEAEFNGTFAVVSVVNRKTITFTMVDSGPTTGTGSPVLLGGESALRDYNTLYQVLKTPSPVEFAISHSVTGLPDPTGTILARTRPRISAAVNARRLFDSYTEQPLDKLWLFVVLGPVDASKSRHIRSDAVDNLSRGDEYRQQVIQTFGLYLFIPVSDDLSGQAGRDVAEDLFRSLCRSILFSSFDSGLYVGEQGKVQFVSHDTFDYNTSVYVHAYEFQQVVDLTFEDTVGPDVDVAFRNINLTILPQLEGTGELTATLDLDDSPL